MRWMVLWLVMACVAGAADLASTGTVKTVCTRYDRPLAHGVQWQYDHSPCAMVIAEKSASGVYTGMYLASVVGLTTTYKASSMADAVVWVESQPYTLPN